MNVVPWHHSWFIVLGIFRELGIFRCNTTRYVGNELFVDNDNNNDHDKTMSTVLIGNHFNHPFVPNPPVGEEEDDTP